MSDWIRDLFKKIREVPAWAVVAGVLLQSAQTTLAAAAWLAILRAAYPRVKITFRLILAAYATAVAMNSFLPANIGTWVMLIMFTTVIAGATFTAMLSGITVQKIPFSVFNIAVYLYLFLSVAGSFSIKLSGLGNHWVLALIDRRSGSSSWRSWRRASSASSGRSCAKQLLVGGAILGSPRKALVGVALPELGSYLARLAIIAVFLGAYSIPVTFHNVAAVTASNSISNTVSLTPGGVGVTQAMNSAALKERDQRGTATAYSASQQLITSAWNVVFAVVLVSWVFGWSGGKDARRDLLPGGEGEEPGAQGEAEVRPLRPARRELSVLVDRRWLALGGSRQDRIPTAHLTGMAEGRVRELEGWRERVR